MRPNCSPDGQQILVAIDWDHATFCSIALMSPDGSNIVELTAADFVCENEPHSRRMALAVIFDRFDGMIDFNPDSHRSKQGHRRLRSNNCLSSAARASFF